MTRKITAIILGAFTALAMVAGPAAASPDKADGTCVSKGVKLVTSTPALELGPGLSGAAKAGLVSFVIKDHVFNNASGTEAFLEVPQGTIGC